jgi:REase_DpnII-MboI
LSRARAHATSALATDRVPKTSRSSSGRAPRAPSGSSSQQHKQLNNPLQKARLLEVIKLVTDIAQAKGWTARATAQDTKKFKYATVVVSRHVPDTFERITGSFEIICDDTVQITGQSTSFHSWGFAGLYDAIGNELRKLPWVTNNANKPTSNPPDVVLIECLLRRFQRSARQLRHRYADRPGFHINDEYDVQDLLHAFLRALFDDIRPEEYTPSYAGGASRMDFLLKSE